jgi:hemerythrin-like domain-containing protein
MSTRTTARGLLARRDCLARLGAAAGLAALAGCASAGADPERRAREADEEAGEAEVTPGEDLMQEHGLIERILLLYDEGARRIEGGEALDLAVLASAAGIVRRFVEDYHERLEEELVFPRLEAAGRELALVGVLRDQHQRGRERTDQLMRMVQARSATPELAALLRAFVRMYRPHAAREDTVLFPAFRAVVGGDAYRELGEEFEEREHELLGAHGFEGSVAEVAALERAYGIGDLASFTA